MTNPSVDVIVIGAGVAGLAAARTLAEAGKQVALLEARDRIGGRIYSVPAADGGLPVELGAEFIHGLAPELIALVEEAKLPRFELQGELRCAGSAGLGPCDGEPEVDEVFAALAQDSAPEQDMSFNQFLAQRTLGPQAAAWARNYVEGFNAADADRISVRALAKQQIAEDAISGDRSFRVATGYHQVPLFLLRRFQAAGGQLFLAAAAQAVDWEPGRVTVTTVDGRQWHARSALITLPLGVLQARSVAITPPPAHLLAAADQMAMGPALHMVYEFDSRFPGLFDALRDVSFVLAPGTTPPTWWTTNPNPAPMLTGWIAGRKATSIDTGTLPETGLNTLSSLFNTPIAELKAHLLRAHLHDWANDPYSLGAYSYVPSGALPASEQLSVPVENTLFFAGEHTDTTGHWGTVHGALRSGYRVAAQLLPVL